MGEMGNVRCILL